MIKDNNVKRVLKDDGVDDSILESGNKFENLTSNSISKIEEEMKFKGSWAVRVVLNDRFGGVIIKQMLSIMRIRA